MSSCHQVAYNHISAQKTELSGFEITLKSSGCWLSSQNQLELNTTADQKPGELFDVEKETCLVCIQLALIGKSEHF